MKYSDSRRIKVTDTAIKSGKLDLNIINDDFFDKEDINTDKLTILLDGSFKEKIKIHATRGESLKELIQNIDLSHFFSKNKIKIDEEIILIRSSPSTYRIIPLWESFRFIDLFAGIGGMRIGFENVGGVCVFSSEWDKNAQLTYKANFNEVPKGDITLIDEKSIPDHEILLAGFPCQAFSIIGNRKGFADTRGTLFFEIERILKAKRPPVLLLENVKLFRTHDKGRTCSTVISILEDFGYETHISVLNALDYGVAQKRERTFIVGFQDELVDYQFPKPYNWFPNLSNILENENCIDKKFIASDYIQKKRIERIKQQGKRPFFPSIWHENKGGHIGMHNFSCALRHNASHNYLLVNGRRRPTNRELLRLQGYPENFKILVNHTALRAQAGNSVAIPVITAIAAQIRKSIRNRELRLVKKMKQTSLLDFVKIS